jgi:proton-translocating NADH-quinone oxidoreductase chain N
MQITLLLPEIALTIASLVLFFSTLGRMKEGTLQAITVGLSLFSLGAALCAIGQEGMLFFNTYRVDLLSQIFKVLITLGLVLVLWVGTGTRGVERKYLAEYFLFLVVGALGLVLLVSSHELLTIVMSLEIASFSICVLIPLRTLPVHRVQMEAAVKYFLFGVGAIGIMLFGMSYIFGLTGSTLLGDLAMRLPFLVRDEPLAVIGMTMMLCGFFYKLSLFPMHFLTPDVFEGSANETAGFYATLPKVAVTAVIIRLVSLAGADVGKLTWVLAALAVLSMTVGNLSALVQKDLKRLLAYSSIAHAGYLMIGILSMNRLGLAASIYYLLGYLLMNLACFHVIYQLAPNGENLTFDHLTGLYRRSPLLAFTLAAGAFGLAGIPPTIGFTGKFLIFTAAFQKGFHLLVILAVINAAISLFFYLKMVRAAYSQVDDPGETVVLTMPAKVLAVFFLASIILTGILPQGFIALAEKAVAGLP